MKKGRAKTLMVSCLAALNTRICPYGKIRSI